MFYNRRRLWRFWMVSSFLMMTDEKWLNICKNHEGSVKKEVRKIFTYTFEIFLVVMLCEYLNGSYAVVSLSKKKWYVYDRHLAGINILLYCTKIFLNFALKDYCLWTLCSALFCFLCRLLHILICMYYLGTFSKYGKYFTQLSSKVEIEKDFFPAV